ncbi:unnamed protein product [Clonostachys rhizophaga]|uniref:GDP/GTP exchange factor Sec2 N-terminal domain-containing protein n=1 Tax=Clonostachys rhizophaga TaxID=160324 RepID=A0A9N9VKY1_9HYPO|nr:unnamed protein product [Clonostachys rhizophaga]
MASPLPTTTTTAAPTKLSATTMTTTTSLPSCPNCGDSLPSPEETQAELSQAQARIAELEAQIRTLNEKASAAAERWAGYEEELTKLRSQDQAPPPPPPKNDNPGARIPRGPGDVGLAPHHPTRSFTNPTLHVGGGADRPPQLHRINSVPTSHAQDTAPPDKQTRELLRALSREKLLRKEAEGRLTATSKEIEDLSVSLFEQANNMVADERRARAHLEERVGELEKRDVEKRRRLERLETALARIEHVRSLLDE